MIAAIGNAARTATKLGAATVKGYAEPVNLATRLKPAVVRIAWRYRQRVRNCHPGVWVGRCRAGALGNGLDFWGASFEVGYSQSFLIGLNGIRQSLA
jgi:hypothetical protein